MATPIPWARQDEQRDFHVSIFFACLVLQKMISRCLKIKAKKAAINNHYYIRLYRSERNYLLRPHRPVRHDGDGLRGC